MARSLLASALPGRRGPRNVTGLAVNRLAEIVAREALTEGVRPMLQPLFEQALQSPGITAWVGANDTVSSWALRFLHRARVPVPSRISIMGFDDSEEAFRQNLTSYNWNASGVMAAMVSHIVDWRPSRSRSAPKQPVEIEGFVTDRGSVARRRAR
jgi:DNA-binding LacI/PurR family transcriptional regulator